MQHQPGPFEPGGRARVTYEWKSEDAMRHERPLTDGDTSDIHAGRGITGRLRDTFRSVFPTPYKRPKP